MPRNCIYAIAKDFCETKLQMEFYKKKNFFGVYSYVLERLLIFLNFTTYWPSG